MQSWVAPLCLLALVAACGANAPVTAPPRVTGPSHADGSAAVQVGTKPPGFSVESLTAPQKVTVTPGKVVLVMFWATWNEPCKKSMPKLQALYDTFGVRGFDIAALSVDDDETSAGMGEFARTYGANFPIGWDRGHAIAEAWKPSSMPTIYLVDRSGKVAHIHRGWHDGEDQDLATEIEALLERR